MSYWLFAAMIATSTVVMFGLMYIHTYSWDDVTFSETRAWMALLMGAVMAIVMLGYMRSMYKSRVVNTGILAGAGLVFAATTWLIRSQATVSGLDYMEAMVPHHSIAILTSERARIEDPRVRKLADEIIEAQRKEIAEMKYLIQVLRRDGVRPGEPPRSPARVSPVGEAVQSADIATTDLEPMSTSELQDVLGAARTCRFSYARHEAPVAAATAPGTEASRGVIKLHGRLVPMDVQYREPASAGFELSSGDVSVVASPHSAGAGEARDADALLRIGSVLEVGYGGFYGCGQ